MLSCRRLRFELEVCLVVNAGVRIGRRVADMLYKDEDVVYEMYYR